MKFRTEISIKPFARNIGYSSRIFAAGSCFAENIAERMRQAKFDVASNPTGILFNPASIAAALSRFADGKVYDETELVEADGKWFSYDAHTSLDGRTKEEALRNLNEAVTVGHAKLAALHGYTNSTKPAGRSPTATSVRNRCSRGADCR